MTSLAQHEFIYEKQKSNVFGAFNVGTQREEEERDKVNL